MYKKLFIHSFVFVATCCGFLMFAYFVSTKSYVHNTYIKGLRLPPPKKPERHEIAEKMLPITLNDKETNKQTYMEGCTIPNKTFIIGDMILLHNKCQRSFILKLSTNRTLYALLRVSGCTMQTMLFEYNRDNTWAVQYHTCETGQYFATIKVLFDTLHYDPLKSCLQFSHPLNDFNTTWNEYSSVCQLTSWWKNNHTIPFLTGEQFNIKYRFPFLQYHYNWKPNKVKLDQNELLCFLGDSHMRNTVNSVAQCDSIVAQRNKDVCETSNLKYFEVLYEQDIKKHVPKLTTCTKIILNFGQWYAGRPEKSFTFLDYQKAIFRCIEKFPYKSKLIWMTTNPFPITKRLGKCPPTDWRFPHVLAQYNNIERTVFTENKIQIWDTFSILKHVFDISFDFAHYSDDVSKPIIPALFNLL